MLFFSINQDDHVISAFPSVNGIYHTDYLVYI